MELGLKGKKGLVTGASSGLGEAVAQALAAEGVKLVINSRNPEKLKAAAIKIEKATGHYPETIPGDISLKSDRTKLIVATCKHFNSNDIDILISNGGGPPPGQFLEHSEDSWHEASALVLESAISLTTGFLKSMINKRWGRLIYITSIGVLQPVDELILSNTYRAGVTAFCKTLSNNYAKYGITANCVCPGYTATDRLKNLIKSQAEKAGVSDDEIIKEITAKIPVGRVGRPEELASLITFLASDKASYITGVSIPVDGGSYRGLI